MKTAEPFSKKNPHEVPRLRTKAMKILHSKLNFHLPALSSEVFKFFMTTADDLCSVGHKI
jgi:hypothetical protein